MRRLYIGVALLAALLAAGSCVQWSMTRLHTPAAQKLEQAAAAALEQDWETAHTLAWEAREAWERSHRFTAAVADHGPMDQVDMLYGQMEVCEQSREEGLFATACTQLSRMIRAITEAHTLNWWNLL